jgi:hypothetical protein
MRRAATGPRARDDPVRAPNGGTREAGRGCSHGRTPTATPRWRTGVGSGNDSPRGPGRCDQTTTPRWRTGRFGQRLAARSRSLRPNDDTARLVGADRFGDEPSLRWRSGGRFQLRRSTASSGPTSPPSPDAPWMPPTRSTPAARRPRTCRGHGSCRLRRAGQSRWPQVRPAQTGGRMPRRLSARSTAAVGSPTVTGHREAAGPGRSEHVPSRCWPVASSHRELVLCTSSHRALHPSRHPP